MRAATLSLVLLTGTAGTARAQGSCMDQFKFPEVGRWAEYKGLYQSKTDQNKKDQYTIRYAVIGSENRGGAPLKWLELRMSGAKKDSDMIYQMLVPGSPTEMGNVQEIVFKSGDKPAMKMNGMMMNMIRNQMEKQSFFSDACKDVTKVGEESVTVPAGQFKTTHFKSAKYEADNWVTPSVPFSVVKSTGKNHEIELVAQGNGAKSSITEPPQIMPGVGAQPQE